MIHKFNGSWISSEARGKNLSGQLKSSFFTLTSLMLFSCILLSFIPIHLLNNYLGKEYASHIQKKLVNFI